MKTWVFAAVVSVTITSLFTDRAHAAGAPIIGGSKLYVSASGPTSADGYTYMSPNDLPTTVYFQWGLTTNYGNSTTGQVVNGGFQFVNVPPITGLELAVLYHARAFATNASGVAYSTDETFTTSTAGTAETLQPTNITATTATLRGRVYPSGVSPATAYFQYVRTGGGHPVMFTPTETLINASNRTLVTATITNLDTTAQYAYNLVVNTGPTFYGPTVTFITGANAPIVQTTSASGISPTAATLNGIVNPNGLATDMAFEWGLTTNYGNLTAVQTVGSTLNNLPITASVSQLLPNTNYHFRVRATNGMGFAFGNDETFATFPTNPFAVFTMFPSNITTNSATLNGSVNPNGSPTFAYFQWGTTTNYGAATPPQSIGAGSSFVPVQANLSPLLTDTNYHYRLVASNALGIVYGSNVIVTPTSLLYLYAGESWSYVFHDLPGGSLIQNFGSPFVLGNFTILPNSFAPGSAVRWELFENATNDGAFYSGVVNAPATGGSGGNIGSTWSDLQGAVRLTVLTGSVVVSSIYLQRVADRVSGSFAPLYQNTITPTRVPQPPSLGTQFVNSVSLRSALISADINVKNISSGVFAQWGTTTNYGSASGVTTGHAVSCAICGHEQRGHELRQRSDVQNSQQRLHATGEQPHHHVRGVERQRDSRCSRDDVRVFPMGHDNELRPGDFPAGPRNRDDGVQHFRSAHRARPAIHIPFSGGGCFRRRDQLRRRSRFHHYASAHERGDHEPPDG